MFSLRATQTSLGDTPAPSQPRRKQKAQVVLVVFGTHLLYLSKSPPPPKLLDCKTLEGSGLTKGKLYLIFSSLLPTCNICNTCTLCTSQKLLDVFRAIISVDTTYTMQKCSDN
jgi:hypothetical protein